MGSSSTADTQLTPLVVAVDAAEDAAVDTAINAIEEEPIDPESTVYAATYATTMDSTAVFDASVFNASVFNALWEDEDVGYAVLDVLDAGEAFRFASLNTAMATLITDQLVRRQPGLR